MKKLTPLLTTSSLLAACAHVPDAEINYPYARTESLVSVVRTLSCDSGNRPLVLNTTTVTTSNRADIGGIHGRLQFKRLNSQFANTTLDLKFAEDGRLTSVNAEAAGQGEAIIKSALGLVGSLAGIGSSSEKGMSGAKIRPKQTDKVEPAVLKQCQEFRNRYKDNSLTLTYAETINFDAMGSIPIKPTVDSDAEAQKYPALLGTLYATVKRVEPWSPVKVQSAENGARPPSEKDDRPRPPIVQLAQQAGFSGALLTARQPHPMELAVIYSSGAVDKRTGPLWEATIPVAQAGKEYQIPIPAAAAFGKQVFKVEFSDNGAVTELHYGSDTGATGAIDSIQAFVDQVKPRGAAALAKELDDQVALIKSRQNLLKCQQDPGNCQ